jgi:hypothetical protein
LIHQPFQRLAYLTELVKIDRAVVSR